MGFISNILFIQPLYPTFILSFAGLIGFTLASPDGFGRQQHGRQGRRGRAHRRGRQEDLGAEPLGAYGAADAPLDSYGAESELDAKAAAELAALEANIPGIPGEDYPIYSEVPESGFVCDGQVDGGNINLIFKDLSEKWLGVRNFKALNMFA